MYDEDINIFFLKQDCCEVNVYVVYPLCGLRLLPRAHSALWYFDMLVKSYQDALDRKGDPGEQANDTQP